MERLPQQHFLLKQIYHSSYKLMIKLCGNCSEQCIILDEHDPDTNSYLCMICRGVGYQCRNFRYCHNFYNYEDIRSGKILLPKAIDQYCESCQHDKCLLDVVGNHPKKARIGLADEYNLCYSCYKSTCECKANEVDLLLLNSGNCIRSTEYPHYWRYIIHNRNKRTYDYYCNFCYQNCVILDEKHTFSHQEITESVALRRKHGEGYMYYKCDCYTCLE